MEFTLACNWDLALIDQLDSKRVKGFFGQYTDDPFGGGRGSFLVPKVTKEEAEVFIKKAKERGFAFNYLLNGACLNNHEFIRDQFSLLMNHLEWVNSLNVDMVTVSLPFLLNLIKKNFPRLQVCVSSWARIESANRAQYWEEMGADKLILQEHVNRNFKALKSIRKAVKCQLEVIANPSCLFTCPYEYNHINMMTHSSQPSVTTEGFVVDHCQLSCQKRKLEKPVDILKARWIRPEDVGVYDEIGIDTLKLLERFRTTASLLKVVQAYTERKFDGNLIELLTLPNKGSFNPPNLEYLLKPEFINIGMMMRMADVFGYSFPEIIYLDNRQLDDFLEGFKKRDCLSLYCGDCRYCEKVSEKAIRILDENKRQEILKKFDSFLDDLYSGRICVENPPIELKGMKLTKGAEDAFKIILDIVPQPVRPFVEPLTLHGAEQMAESQNEKEVREGDIVFSFWMGTPETSKEEVKNFLKSRDLFKYVEGV
jgi:collagenase-like PrtC family protease